MRRETSHAGKRKRELEEFREALEEWERLWERRN